MAVQLIWLIEISIRSFWYITFDSSVQLLKLKSFCNNQIFLLHRSHTAVWVENLYSIKWNAVHVFVSHTVCTRLCCFWFCFDYVIVDLRSAVFTHIFWHYWQGRRELPHLKSCATDLWKLNARTKTYKCIFVQLSYYLPWCYNNAKNCKVGRLVTKTKKFDHLTSVLQELHWLPFDWCPKFKILLLVYKYMVWPHVICKTTGFKTKPWSQIRW